MSLVGFDGCPIAASDYLGRAPNIDHPANRFFCDLIAAKEYTYSPDSHGPPCIGNQYSHSYTHDYAKTFSNLYVGANQLIYLHANAGHEGTGQRAESADKDVASFIKYYIETYSESHELVIYVIGDHGIRYGVYTPDHKSMQEYRLPAFFVLARHTLLDQIPNLALHENTLRLTTKKDIRESVLWLGNWYRDSSYSTTEPFSNLFTDLISTERTCEDIGVTSWHCATSELKEVPPSAYTDRKALDAIDQGLYDLINRATTFTVSTLNEIRNGATSGGTACQTLTLDSLVNVMHTKHVTNNNKRVLQLELRMKEGNAQFIALLFVPGSGYSPIKHDNKFKFGGETTAITLISYRRLNWTPENCPEVLTKHKFARPDICVCNK